MTIKKKNRKRGINPSFIFRSPINPIIAEVNRLAKKFDGNFLIYLLQILLIFTLYSLIDSLQSVVFFGFSRLYFISCIGWHAATVEYAYGSRVIDYWTGKTKLKYKCICRSYFLITLWNLNWRRSIQLSVIRQIAYYCTLERVK